MIRIAHLHTVNREEIRGQLAAMLHQAFPWPDGYPTLEEAREEVLDSLNDDRINLVALGEDEQASR